MTHYQIIADRQKFDEFLSFLPDTLPHEVWYLCLFGRHKYDPSFPNTRDSGQLARIIARDKPELVEKVTRLETPMGSYSRHGVQASQNAVAVYIAPNPRSLIKANKTLLVELANRFAAGEIEFNPISAANTEIHRAVDRKFFLTFDYDDAQPSDHLPKIREALPDDSMFRILKTRGGFHLMVILDKIKGLKTQWHKALSNLPKCDVRGTNNLCPVPGCVQGGFIPHFVDL